MIKEAKTYQELQYKGRMRQGLLDPLVASKIPLDTESLLDVGCGAAEYHELLLTKRPNIKKLVGIEFSSEQLGMVRKLPKTEYHKMSVFDIQLE